MNYKAIDVGATAFIKIDVPASWANAEDDDCRAPSWRAVRATVKMVKEILLSPSTRWTATACLSPPLTIMCRRHLPRRALPPMRSAALPSALPDWDPEKCIQCNQCSYRLPSCHHPSLYALDEAEAGCRSCKRQDGDFKAGKGKGVYKFAIAVSPAGLHGLRRLRQHLPHQGHDHGSLRSPSWLEQDVFDYMRSQSRRQGRAWLTRPSRAASSREPLLEFSGSCAGCAEIHLCPSGHPAVRRSHVSSPTPPAVPPSGAAPAATSPYTVNKEGKGPAWANSLFEDNAEHGLGHVLWPEGHP